MIYINSFKKELERVAQPLGVIVLFACFVPFNEKHLRFPPLKFKKGQEEEEEDDDDNDDKRDNNAGLFKMGHVIVFKLNLF